MTSDLYFVLSPSTHQLSRAVATKRVPVRLESGVLVR